MVSDAESTTNRKRPERLQQNTRVRSRSFAVTHSIEGSIHSSESIKSQKKRTQSSKNRIDSTENITATEAELRERRFRLVAVRPLGYARLSRLRPPWVDFCQPTDLRLCPTNTRQRLLLRPCCRISRVVRDPQRVQPRLYSGREA